jgi:hypothetical protein
MFFNLSRIVITILTSPENRKIQKSKNPDLKNISDLTGYLSSLRGSIAFQQKSKKFMGTHPQPVFSMCKSPLN